VRNLTKPFSIGGFIVGEIYLGFAATAPYHTGDPVEPGVVIQRLLIGALFFGPFGALIGMGIGLLVGAALPKPSPATRTQDSASTTHDPANATSNSTPIPSSANISNDKEAR